MPRVYSSIYLSIYLSIYPSIYLSIYPFIYLSICLSRINSKGKGNDILMSVSQRMFHLLHKVKVNSYKRFKNQLISRCKDMNKCYNINEMGHFHKLLCEEMICPLHKGKNDGLRYEVIIFSFFLEQINE